MTPTLLAAYLKTLRDGGAVSAELVLGPSAQGGDSTVRVMFAPEVGAALPPGDPVTPGGWKSPSGLDAGREFEPEQREAP